MKTAVHIVLILLVGTGAGLAIRNLRPASPAAGPGPDDIVYTNDGADGSGASPVDREPIGSGEPSRPPEDDPWLSSFELTERDGSTVSSEDLLGKPYVVSFFYSTCPSICVQQNQKLQELQNEFEDRGVRFVAISVDPETDTPEVLQEYAARFGADPDQWLFLTGELTYIRRIGTEIFRQPVNKQFHTERFVLVDSEGEIEALYNWPDPRQFDKLRVRIAEMIESDGDAKDA